MIASVPSIGASTFACGRDRADLKDRAGAPVELTPESHEHVDVPSDSAADFLPNHSTSGLLTCSQGGSLAALAMPAVDWAGKGST